MNEPPCGKTAGYQKQNSLRRFLSFLQKLRATGNIQLKFTIKGRCAVASLRLVPRLIPREIT
ncbi:MAG: hypothetical protein KAI96_08460, partial [Thermodesulfovibrionia bacterium]|nr:hypothetical protein [Thermodesulfovibrionia bacterium]